ncbi:uncharacterized protein [Amphiura filiformis]|uniref:uncharacterized protein isoform X1 n=1 Tax=Amphiura filiformis TaxID=82378 RepID=UPI003B21D036
MEGKQPAENKGLEAVLYTLPDQVTEGVLPAGTCETIPQNETQTEDQEIDNANVPSSYQSKLSSRHGRRSPLGVASNKGQVKSEADKPLNSFKSDEFERCRKFVRVSQCIGCSQPRIRCSNQYSGCMHTVDDTLSGRDLITIWHHPQR